MVDDIRVWMTCAAVCVFLLIKKKPEAQHDSSLTGHMYMMELLNSRSAARFRNVNMMNKRCFVKLLNLLCSRNLLKSGRKVSACEKLMTLLYVLGNAASKRNTSERWQHSTSTMCINLRETVEGIYALRHQLFVYPRPNIIQPAILNNMKFRPYFARALGAIDGTHIAAVVSQEAQTA